MKKRIKEGSENYCCTVVVIKDLFPIKGADRILRTIVFSNDVIVSNSTKIGDRYLYFNSGTQLNEDFCKYNNLLDKKELNKDKIKGLVSYKQRRIKCIKLKEVISDGILLPLESIWSLGDFNLVDFKEGDTFTTLNDILVCEKYFVPVRNANPRGKAPKQPTKISRLVENQFYLHNDTENLRRNIHKISPDSMIGIHFKKHGTSFVAGNVLTAKSLRWYEKILKRLGVKIVDTEYDIVFSSRKVVKNKYLNPEKKQGYYSEDIWGIVAKEIGHLIPKGITLYGEILGYLPSGGAIQGLFDYGCNPGKHKFYVYKISSVNSDGKVIYFTDRQIEEFCEVNGLLFKDTFIYYGKAEDMFHNLKTDQHWHENFLAALEKRFNEKDCYMCVNPVPEEGIVLRVERLYEYEAYKLKSKRFLLAESEEQEKEITNIENN